MIEIILVAIILIFIVTYNTSKGESVYKFVNTQANNIYSKYGLLCKKQILYEHNSYLGMFI